ncbi:hypothetical protein RB195_006111 [Necator americanus]|uniref:Uncharacterized protein n=1 Tax=Necator americanus TaxID=51031 RepID=A0ABR1BUS9_NECAM
MHVGATDRAFSLFREIAVHCSRRTADSQDWQQNTAHLHMDAPPVLQFVERYCNRATKARLIFELFVSGFEATREQGAHRPLRRCFSAEYLTQVLMGFSSGVARFELVKEYVSNMGGMFCLYRMK